jgi:hypothetical protein
LKPEKHLFAAQKKMRARVQNPTRVGRPRLNIEEDTIIRLLQRGYTPKGIAIALGCSRRTLGRRFPYLIPGSFKDPVMREKALFYQRALAGDLFSCKAYLKGSAGISRRRSE